jgi:rare lipoprotein A
MVNFATRNTPLTPTTRALACVVLALWLVGCANAPKSELPDAGATPTVSKTPSPSPSSPPIANSANSAGSDNAAPSTSANSPAATPDATASPLVSTNDNTTGWTESGIASWYGPRFQGKRTANGERFNTNELTAAHKTLPFGTRVRVKSQVNGKEVVVRINDRGPFIKGRIIDLSYAAAQAIGLVGVKKVEIERLR